jgi:hypothetical protein
MTEMITVITGKTPRTDNIDNTPVQKKKPLFPK